MVYKPYCRKKKGSSLEETASSLRHTNIPTNTPGNEKQLIQTHVPQALLIGMQLTSFIYLSLDDLLECIPTNPVEMAYYL